MSLHHDGYGPFPEGPVVAELHTGSIEMKIYLDPPRLAWSDGPRADIEEFDSIVDALRAMTTFIEDTIANADDIDEAFR